MDLSQQKRFASEVSFIKQTIIRGIPWTGAYINNRKLRDCLERVYASIKLEYSIRHQHSHNCTTAPPIQHQPTEQNPSTFSAPQCSLPKFAPRGLNFGHNYVSTLVSTPQSLTHCPPPTQGAPPFVVPQSTAPAFPPPATAPFAGPTQGQTITLYAAQPPKQSQPTAQDAHFKGSHKQTSVCPPPTQTQTPSAPDLVPSKQEEYQQQHSKPTNHTEKLPAKMPKPKPGSQRRSRRLTPCSDCGKLGPKRPGPALQWGPICLKCAESRGETPAPPGCMICKSRSPVFYYHVCKGCWYCLEPAQKSTFRELFLKKVHNGSRKM